LGRQGGSSFDSVRATPTLHLLGNSPIQAGVLGTGDFTGQLVACCLVRKDRLPEELGVWQPRGAWEELLDWTVPYSDERERSKSCQSR